MEFKVNILWRKCLWSFGYSSILSHGQFATNISIKPITLEMSDDLFKKRILGVNVQLVVYVARKKIELVAMESKIVLIEREKRFCSLYETRQSSKMNLFCVCDMFYLFICHNVITFNENVYHFKMLLLRSMS